MGESYAREDCPWCRRSISIGGWDGRMRKHNLRPGWGCRGSGIYPTLRMAERERRGAFS